MDLIERQAAIDTLGEEPEVWEDMYTASDEYSIGLRNQWRRFDKNAYSDSLEIEALPSASEDDSYRQGEWDMFELITSAWFGKQCYFEEEHGLVYSRNSCKTLSRHDAILEFLRKIGDE